MIRNALSKISLALLQHFLPQSKFLFSISSKNYKTFKTKGAAERYHKTYNIVSYTFDFSNANALFDYFHDLMQS